MWDIDQCAETGHIAYAGADGEVITAPPDFQFETRAKPAHTAVAGDQFGQGQAASFMGLLQVDGK